MSVHVGPLTSVIRELNVPTPQGLTRVHVLVVTPEMESRNATESVRITDHWLLSTVKLNSC